MSPLSSFVANHLSCCYYNGSSRVEGRTPARKKAIWGYHRVALLEEEVLYRKYLILNFRYSNLLADVITSHWMYHWKKLSLLPSWKHYKNGLVLLLPHIKCANFFKKIGTFTAIFRFLSANRFVCALFVFTNVELCCCRRCCQCCCLYHHNAILVRYHRFV